MHLTKRKKSITFWVEFRIYINLLQITRSGLIYKIKINKTYLGSGELIRYPFARQPSYLLEIQLIYNRSYISIVQIT